MQTVLALETSCDETAVAIVRFRAGRFHVLANCIASQADEHSQWGGVVPEIASRRHLETIPFLIEKALNVANINCNEIDCIGATVTPGLTGALLVGSVTGRTLASLHRIPFIGVHHLEGHLSSALLSEQAPVTPYLVLLVSGGHTELIRVNKDFDFLRLGKSHDDAAGEAFDKVARLLGLSYPGGPAIQRLAKNGNPKRFPFPKGKVSKPGGGFYPYDFSFSGLKTAVLRQVETFKSISQEMPVEDLAASFEQVVAEVLVERSLKCALDEGINSMLMVGGVAANNRLRQLMLSRSIASSVNLHLASKEFCTDNAVMIGLAALRRFLLGNSSSSRNLGVSARLPLDQADLLYGREPPF
ncbi:MULTISPECIES: tRNA (adenosine(37)-N6)-threonylcarbamoyltransferase complex transferase subunit TsaD [Prochlorococcus]|uniref:tRNA (adenosine(37)-N6)-threonylcarbamoyltransferase complex transferase subunit TsaD n=1 Tax=Prochlorococcus TaxID=1218 RepID=UPI00056B3D85|nr:MULTISPECIES: tRNA (adenosine(37)-N6)-threonylcarbamoyltransferase complex transferase subunit TsaD [Prochlorococcus]